MWSVKSLRSPITENLAAVNMLNSLKNCTTTLPSYFFITLAKFELKNVGLSVFEILEVFVKTLPANKKYYLRNRKNLWYSVQLQLSKKQKKSEFLSADLKSTSDLEQFEKKKMTLIGYVLSKLETAKKVLS